ncbi:SDR family NAD(P)-dependent oxidoreductase [Georgenia sp. 10Sc9-8]|uniref:SDR family NAD(P)-dependent oxidoreductase n=1 Tax=Georgenia halotolerans TaxID=3028317 RepID=A0ABT5TW71_9MICO|nr:SDR family NAD(P)-dependent oxidoreductase [Georgenia halotolerans]
MTGRTIVITGASDGIGAAAARRLSAAGERVVLVGRSPVKTAEVAREVGAPHHVADFARLSEVRDLAERLAADHPRIDVLANNAGGIMGDRDITEDGFEKTLQVNHLGPFLLTHLLMDTLVDSRATVLNTSSIAARLFGRIDVDDLNNEGDYSPEKAYGDAKLANILFTKELHRRFHGSGIATAAFHPGNVATNFASGSTSRMRYVYQTPLRHLALIGPDKGTRTLLWLANGTPGTDWTSGEYYEKKKIATTNPQAADADVAHALWERSLDMVRLSAGRNDPGQ